MEIIEKEKIVEQPEGYCGPNKRDINGKANAGLTLGIIGTALGAWALFGNRRAGLLGGAAGGLGSGLGGANININGLETGVTGGSSRACPTAYEVQMKECDDVLALQGGLYQWALTQQNQRFQDRQTIDSEMFGIYKSQDDADFGLYKSTRDGFDILNAKQQQDAFNLYKSQRDADDTLANRIAALECRVAVNEAVRPYQDKLIQCEIAGVKTNAAFCDERIINYVDRLDCRNIKGQIVLPNTPEITGYAGANRCGCPTVVAAASAPANA